MNPDVLQVRRAIVDDLPQLIELWKTENLPWEILEKRFTEFQVAVDNEGRILGAIGLRIKGQSGLLHNEVFLHFDMADQLRELIWKRIEVIAHNFGLVRIWTLFESPYWHHNGFLPATAEQKTFFPTEFGDPNANWFVMSMRSQAHKTISPEKEFALFKEQERAETERMMQLGKTLKFIATVLAAIMLIGVIVVMIYIVRKLPIK